MAEGLTMLSETAPAGPELAKARTGITGLDEITGGGLPRGRTTLVVGSSGSGKSVLGTEFLVRGARDFDEPGVLLTFEESAAKMADNVRSLGFDLDELQRAGKLVVQGVLLDPREIVETGSFDLDGLFAFLADAVVRVGARRVMLDTIEMLLVGFRDVGTIRAELHRLFRWLDEHNLTAIVTSERGEGRLTRNGIEEYVSDCVIVLDQRVVEDVSTRRLRVVKYRGSMHDANEYPFLITGGGFMVQPLSSLRLGYPASTRRVSTGVPRLDNMLGGGFYEATTVLLSGGSGAGKTTLAAQLVATACQRGERAVYVLYEESPDQLVRNMRSVGIDLARWVDAGLLQFSAARPSTYEMENHLAGLAHLLDRVHPTVVALDALSSFASVAAPREVTSLVTRSIDLMKSRGITAVVTSATHGADISELAVSALIDTWILVRNVESDGERNRLLFVMKSRGSSHSNQVREFVLTDDGIELLDAYLGVEGMSVGAARVNRQAEDRETELHRALAVADRQRELRQQTAQCEAQVTALREVLADNRAEIERLAEEADRWTQATEADQDAMRTQRFTDPAPAPQTDPR